MIHLDWYGWDEDGLGCTCHRHTMRPIPLLLKGWEYHHCCHSNLTRALAAERICRSMKPRFTFTDVMTYSCALAIRATRSVLMKAAVGPRFHRIFAEIICGWALACPAATAAPVTPTTLPNAIRKVEIQRRRESVGRLAVIRGRTNILARMEPVRATPTDPDR